MGFGDFWAEVAAAAGSVGRCGRPRRLLLSNKHNLYYGRCLLGWLACRTGGGWTLHQLRHSRLTHLAEAGVGLPMLMTKSRHTSLASLAIYAKPTFDAVAAATAALDPDRRR